MGDITEDKINALADALSIRQKAADDARQNIPNSVAPQWAIKSDIVRAVADAGEQEIKVMERGYSAAGEAIEGLKGKMDNFMRWRPNDSGARDAENTRDRALKALTQITADYNSFKRDNGLARDAYGDDRVTQIVWAIFIIVAEGIVNSFFLKDISEHGFSGGFLWAFFISFVNVGFAFCGGVLGARYFVNHFNVNNKLMGLIWLLLCLSVCVMTVALSAWFRGHAGELLAAKSVEIGEISNMAWKNALASAAKFDIMALFLSPESSLLFLIGVLCTMFGLYKGYQYDDPYPGFGDMSRTKENAQDEYERARKHYEEQAQVCRREYANQHRGLADALNTARSHVNGFVTSVSHNEDIENKLIHLAQGVLSIYRRENARVRSATLPEEPADLFDGEFGAIKNRYNEYAAKSAALKEELHGAEEKFDSISPDYQPHGGEGRR